MSFLRFIISLIILILTINKNTFISNKIIKAESDFW